MRTKHEESSVASSVTRSPSPGLPNTTVSALPQARRCEARCLQDLGDLRQLSTAKPGLLMLEYHGCGSEINVNLEGALGTVMQEIIVWARQHEADGRYRDAEYLFRRAYLKENIPEESVDSHLSKDVLPTLVSLYERIGDYPAAEMAQETLLRGLFSDSTKQITGEHRRAVYAYSKLLFDFRRRVLDLGFDLFSLAYHMNMLIAYRVAVLDIPLLNEVSLDQGLINLKPLGFTDHASLHVAAKQNAIHLARLLIVKGADVNGRGFSSCTSLHIAAHYADSAMVELLLANGAETQVKDWRGVSPLHAALTGKSVVQNLALLVDAQADMEAKDVRGRTALHIAVENDVPAAAHFLLQCGANSEVADSFKETLLFTAVFYRREWAIKLLLEKGANVKARNEKGETALYVAIGKCQEPIVQILLDHGKTMKTAVDQRFSFHRSLLHIAVTKASVSIVGMLLRAAADICAADDNGNTALHEAVLGGQEPHEQIVRLLLTQSAPLDAVNQYGSTVLHLAVHHARRNMILIILHHTPPTKLSTICEMRDDIGRTPLDIAQDLDKDANESSDARSILYLLENALKLSHTYI